MHIEFYTNDSQYISEVNNFINEWNSALEYIDVKTSGSTGTPSLIRLQKKYMIASAKMTGDFLKLKAGDVALLCLSVKTIAGKMMIVRSIVLDLNLVVVDVDSKPLANFKGQIDFAAMVPLQAQNSLTSLNRVDKLIIGGGTLSNNLFKSVSELKIKAFHTYGMTETISHIAMREISFENSYFKTLHGVEIKVVDECLNVTVSNLGIENLQTNDIVSLMDKSHFEWKGRKDFIVNSGGVKINPELVEAALENLIQVPFFTIGLMDEVLGEKLILCIEGWQNIEKSAFTLLLNKYSIPKEVYFFDKFQRTESGKVNRIKTIELIKDAERKVL